MKKLFASKRLPRVLFVCFVCLVFVCIEVVCFVVNEIGNRVSLSFPFQRQLGLMKDESMACWGSDFFLPEEVGEREHGTDH